MKDSFKMPISPETEGSRSLLAYTVLLERYRFLLFKQIATLLLSRVVSFLLIGFVVISIHISLVQLFAVVLISVVVTTIWHYERRLENSQARTLSDDLARQSGEEELDFYIRSGYNVDRKASVQSVRSWASYEPQIWLILTIVFVILQYIF